MKIYKGKHSHKILRIYVEEGFFCLFKNNTSTIAFHCETLSDDLFEKILFEVQSHISGSIDNCEILVVGIESVVDLLQKNFSKNKLEVTKIKKRIKPFTVLYDSEKIALRISKEIMVQVKKIKILIVEDSKTMRTVLKKIFSQDRDLEIVGAVESAEEVTPVLKKLKPDVMTLDINLPGKNGVDLLKELGSINMVPTVLITSLNINDSNRVFEALEAGAIDYIQKPALDQLEKQSQIIIDKVKAAATANLNSHKNHSSTIIGGRMAQEIPIFIGSSTGGTVALQKIFERLPVDIPPIVVVQHIPAIFSKSFADRLNNFLPFRVKEAEDGDRLLSNQILIAPGGRQMKLIKNKKEYFLTITNDEPVNRFKPSVDYLFHSVAEVYKEPMIGLILTGMGRDGAKGLLAMQAAGAETVAQDKRSCVVFGMPRAAIDLGAVNNIVNLSDIPQKLAELTLKLKKQKSVA